MNIFLRGIIIAASVAGLGGVSVSADAQPKKVRLGVEGAYPPFSEIDTSGKLKGFDIDIANALCAQMKVECVMVQLSFDGMIPALNSRKIDGVIASMSITDERKKAVDFSDKYYYSPARFIAKADSKVELSAAGLKGKRIGVQRSTTNDRYLSEVYKDAQILRYTSLDDVYLDLTSGRLDLAFMDSVAADLGFLKRAQGRGFAFFGPPLSDRKYFGDGAGIAVRKSDAGLRDDFNRAIASIRASGEYKKIADRYFDFDIYGAAPSATNTSKK